MTKAKTVLVLYITDRSGHHSAALAIKRALEHEDASVKVHCVNAFRYIFPIAERLTHRIYLTVIKRVPKIWEKMYDNPRLVDRTSGIKAWIHRRAVKKMSRLLKQVKPDAIVCTQAFPVGIIAAFKDATGSRLPLIGVLTDFFPHAFWVYDQVDHYIVPSEEGARFLDSKGVPLKKIHILGIPIDPKFGRSLDHAEVLANYGLTPEIPVVMLMGGGHGLGPIKKVLNLCDSSDIPMQFIVVCGMNRKLYHWLSRRRVRKKIVYFKYTDQIDRLMTIASVLITKPGGITTAEALAKHLPMVILNPIPGQEARNTGLLVRYGAAIEAGTPQDVLPAVLNTLVASKKRHGIFSFSHNMHRLAKPEAATLIARLALQTS